MAENNSTWRFFGLTPDAARQRLAECGECLGLRTRLTVTRLDGTLELTADDGTDVPQEALAALRERFGVYLYSERGESLAARAVALLKENGQTVATAESCTGGMIASLLTAVPGCSQVFGTGIVSYSWDCKEALLGVSHDTLTAYGAVSRQTAGEMARGVRETSGASLGISVTGEAGPLAGEDQPVGTVFVALADDKRVWIREYHFTGDGYDREGIRQTAAACALDLLRRYLEASPAVMAGGEPVDAPASQPPQEDERTHGLLPFLHRIPRKRRLLTAVACAAALILVICGLLRGYQMMVAPRSNRALQDSLGELYWGNTEDLTVPSTDARYPAGMMAQFRGLYDLNKDIGGWVRITDTIINYPIMTYSGGFYVNHSFSEQFSVYGQPYFDAENGMHLSEPERALVVYGNNTRDEQMFSSLLSYRRIAYLQEHPVIELNTLYAASRWEIFAVAVDDSGTSFDGTAVDFADDAAFAAHIAALRERSLFRCDLEVTAQDEIVLLVTDADKEYDHADTRLLIAAKRMSSDTPTATYRVNGGAKMPESWTRNGRRTKKTTASATATTQAATQATTSTTAAHTGDTGASTAATEPSETETEPSETATTEPTQPTSATEPTEPTQDQSDGDEQHDDIGN